MGATTKFSERRVRIGGEMELNPEMLDRSKRVASPRILDEVATITTGRTALALIAHRLRERQQRRCKVLLPSYLCPSILQPFREAAVDFSFYPVAANLTVDPDRLHECVRAHRPCACLFINYFGFPPHPETATVLREIREQSLLIEDCAHGSMVEQANPVVGSIGHFVFTSFRKYLPLPDGGILLNRSGLPLVPLPPASGQFIEYRLSAKIRRFQSMQVSRYDTRFDIAYLSQFAEAERIIDRECPLMGMSDISKVILCKICLNDVMAARRRNYSILAGAFETEPVLRAVGLPLIAQLPVGISPLLFPIRVSTESRDSVRRALAERGIYCPVHWHLPMELGEAAFSESWQLSRQILGLPIDQRYSEEDMQELIRQLRMLGRVQS
jgi:dTDP-4-amino-4,6-dideoxygalactose transaminase